MLVPIETWQYQSPALAVSHDLVDVGLLAEALIYYDEVTVNLSTERQFEAFVLWFVGQGRFDELIALLEHGHIRIFHFAFMTAPIWIAEARRHEIWNLNAPPVTAGVPDFMSLVAYRADLREVLNTRQRSRLLKASESVLTEVRAADYEVPVEDARKAMQDPDRVAALLQAFVDEVYPRFDRVSPEVRCTAEQRDDGATMIHTNIDFKEVAVISGGRLSLDVHIPIAGEAISNRLLWTASGRGFDLFLGDVMATVLGNRLRVADERIVKTQQLLENLHVQVDFPDVRALVNARKLDLDFVLSARRHGERFRTWLQQESERDRDALIAYHHEVGRAVGWRGVAASALKVFGYITRVGGYGTALAASAHSQPALGVAGTAAAGASELITSVSRRIAEEWRPVIFGDWIRKSVDRKS